MAICDSDPDRHHGREVWLPPHLVVESRSDSFLLQVHEYQVRVYSPLPPKVGTYVMVYGKYRELLTVDAISWREEWDYVEKRLGVIFVSLVVLGFALVAFRRAFQWRDGAFHPR